MKKIDVVNLLLIILLKRTVFNSYSGFNMKIFHHDLDVFYGIWSFFRTNPDLLELCDKHSNIDSINKLPESRYGIPETIYSEKNVAFVTFGEINYKVVPIVYLDEFKQWGIITMIDRLLVKSGLELHKMRHDEDYVETWLLINGYCSNKNKYYVNDIVMYDPSFQLPPKIKKNLQSLEDRGKVTTIPHPVSYLNDEEKRDGKRRHPGARPRYRNPENGTTWTGRGRPPSWVSDYLQAKGWEVAGRGASEEEQVRNKIEKVKILADLLIKTEKTSVATHDLPKQALMGLA